MASGLYATGWKEVQDGTIDADTDTLKLMLVDDNYIYDSDHDVIDNGENDASDPSFCELVATNYTGGHGGAGRKAVTVAINANKTDNTVDFVFTDVTWTALGGAVNGTIGGIILVKENANDGVARLIAFFDVDDVTTTGTDLPTGFSPDGNIRVPMS